jgi:hypothetical protein
MGGVVKPCDGCGGMGRAVVEIEFCEECERLAVAFLAALKPGVTKPGVAIGPERRLLLAKMQDMALQLIDASVAAADPGLDSEALATTVATVGEMYAAMVRRAETGAKLKDLLN